MSKSNNKPITTLLVGVYVFIITGITGVTIAHAAASIPPLGTAANFSVLASLSMSSISSPTTISGNLGLSPGVASSRTGTWTVGGAEYFGDSVDPTVSANAETDALGAWNNMIAQTTSGGWGTSPWSPAPGVWTNSSSPAFTGTITLNGSYSDIWVFQISTDFTFSGSVVLAGNAQACHVFWEVARDATIASGSQFVGTLIADRDITFAGGATVNGRMLSLTSSLAMNGTATSITGPTCNAAPAPGTLHVVKTVDNTGGGTSAASAFSLHVKLGASDVATSPQSGIGGSGTAYSLDPGTYVVSEDASSTYSKVITGDCDSSGSIALASGASKTCTITNTYNPPTTATLHVIKLVVGGSKSASDFSVHVKLGASDVATSPQPGTGGLGTSYTLSPGTYVVSEAADAKYTQSFSGFCDSSGSMTLVAGMDKTCTIINTDPGLAPPPAFVSSGGSGLIVPAIGILKVPSPLALPGGSGQVTYNYTVWNVGGQQSLTGITVVDDKCGPLVLISGDLNNNSKLDPGESWKYSCTTTIVSTTVNTAVATGYSDNPSHQAAIATAVATVVVGSALPPPLINIVKLPDRLIPLPVGGGSVTYTYTVTNPGVVAMHDVSVADDKCASVSGPSGDTNGNKLLDPGESWVYTCQMNIQASTRNIATARGSANGFTAIGYAFATVLVSGAPGLPSTGLPPEGNSSIRDIVIAMLALMALSSVSLFTALKRR